MKKRYKILIISSVVVIVLLIIAQVYANSVVQKFIRNEINTLAEEQKDEVYISVDKIRVQLFLKRCILSGVEVHSIDTLPTRLDNSFSIKLNRLILKLDGLTDIYSGGKLKLSSIILNEPIINYTYKVKIDSLAKSEKSVFKSDKFSQVQLSSFEIKNGQLRLNKFKDSTLSLVTTVFSVDFNMEDVLLNLDEEKIEEKLSFNKIDLNVGNTIFHDTENHDISFGNLKYSSNKEGLKIGELEFRNKAPIEKIKGDFDVKEPWINSRIKNLFFKMDFKKLKNKELYFSTIDIDKLDLTLYQNKKDSSDFSIEGLLASIPIPLSIDSLKMKNTNLDFSLVNKKGENDDYVLKKLILSMNYISNDSAYTSLHPEIIGDIKSNVWQKGSVETTFSYNLTKNKTLLKLNVKDFPQRKLKKYFKENELVSFNKGNIISAKLDVLRDSSHIEGNIFLHLNNLDIAFNKFSKSSKLNSISSTLKKLHLHASLFKSGEKQADLYIDTLIIESPRLTIIEKENINPAKNSIQSKIDPQQKNPLDAFITIDYVSIENASISYKKKGLKQPLVAANKVSLRERSLVIDLSKEGIQKIVNTGFYSLSISQFELFQEPSNYLSFKNAELNKKDNTVDITGFRYKNKSSKQFFHNSAEEGNNWSSAYVESIAIDIDLERLLKKEIYCPSIIVTKPILTHIRALNREEKIKEKAFKLSIPISVDKIEIVDADIDIRIKKEKEKEFEIFDLTELSGSFKDFKINETTTSGSSLFSGGFTSSFYKKGKLSVSFTHDFKKKNSVSLIEGEVKNIPLPMFKEKFTSIASIPIENSSLSSLNFKMTIKNQKISGEVNLDSLSIGKYGLSKDKDSDWLSLSMKRIEVGFSHSENDKFHFTSVHLINPNIAMHEVRDAKNDKTKHQSPSSLFASKEKFVAKSKIDKFSLEDGVYRQFKGNTENSPVYSIQNITLTGKNIEIYDSTNTKIPVSIRGLDAGLQTIVVHSLPEQDMSIEHFSLSLTDNKVQIKNLRLINKQTVETFFKTLKYRKPWIDLYVPEMEMDIELNKLFSTHPSISKVNINKAVFNTLINVGLDQSPKEKPFPNRILANSKFPITVDSILVSNSQLNIQFKENKSKFGLLQFNDVNASVSNLSSDPHQVKKNNEMIWDFHATLWETGKSHVIVNYELESENDKFTMYGKCNDLVMTDSDTLTKNLYGISVNDGILYHTYFEIEGNNDEAGGTVSFDYEDLRVSLDKRKKRNIKNPDEMKKVKEKDKLSQSFVKSMIVNGLLSKKNLPEKSNYIAQGQAYYKREKDKPIFHLMWFSLSSGILEIAEAGVVKEFRNFNNLFKKKKVEE